MASAQSNVQTIVRVRPPVAREVIYDQAVDVVSDVSIVVSNGEQRFSSTFDKVLGAEAGQVEVYEQVAGSVTALLSGFNNCIFAYGQTGTGKTYTMHGDGESPAETAGGGAGGGGAGIIGRAVRQLFAEAAALQEDRGTVVQVVASYMEIYNDRLYDLLQPFKNLKDPHDLVQRRTGLEVREDRKGGTYVPNLLTVKVRSAEAVAQLLAEGNRTRAVRHTEMNQHSSRSHAILQLIVEQWPAEGAKTVTRSKLNFVDLAGSEKWNKTASHFLTGDRISEMTSINTSLSALANVVAALESRAKHVPYRSSKLTQLLQDSLGGNCRTVMIATVSPSADAFDETCSTLRFADRVRNLTCNAVVNVSSDVTSVLELKEREISRLRRLLQSLMAMNEEGESSPEHRGYGGSRARATPATSSWAAAGGQSLNASFAASTMAAAGGDSEEGGSSRGDSAESSGGNAAAAGSMRKRHVSLETGAGVSDGPSSGVDEDHQQAQERESQSPRTRQLEHLQVELDNMRRALEAERRLRNVLEEELNGLHLGGSPTRGGSFNSGGGAALAAAQQRAASPSRRSIESNRSQLLGPPGGASASGSRPGSSKVRSPSKPPVYRLGSASPEPPAGSRRRSSDTGDQRRPRNVPALPLPFGAAYDMLSVQEDKSLRDFGTGGGGGGVSCNDASEGGIGALRSRYLPPKRPSSSALVGSFRRSLDSTPAYGGGRASLPWADLNPSRDAGRRPPIISQPVVVEYSDAMRTILCRSSSTGRAVSGSRGAAGGGGMDAVRKSLHDALAAGGMRRSRHSSSSGGAPPGKAAAAVAAAPPPNTKSDRTRAMAQAYSVSPVSRLPKLPKAAATGPIGGGWVN